MPEFYAASFSNPCQASLRLPAAIRSSFLLKRNLCFNLKIVAFK